MFCCRAAGLTGAHIRLADSELGEEVVACPQSEPRVSNPQPLDFFIFFIFVCLFSWCVRVSNITLVLART